jgi:enediyne biosynthesis protein E4
VDFGDYDNDGWLDVVIGNFYGEPCALYRNRRDGSFEETTWSSGIGRPTVPVLTWGTRFFDYDNDGWNDLLFVNGHVYPEVDAHHLDETYAERSLLFRNNGNGTYTDAGAAAGDVWLRRWAGRGAAIGDYDNDGRLDAAVAIINGPPVLLHNRGGGRAHWLTIKLVGTKSNRDAAGARVTAVVGGRSSIEEVHGGGSYLSHSDLRLHFGLGEQTRVESLEVAWPSGRRERIGALDGDQVVTIEEGSGVRSQRKR